MIIYPIFIPNKGCPFKCNFCDQKQFESVKETTLELLTQQVNQFCLNHALQEKQIAFFGGTFTGLPLAEKEMYCKLVEPYLDDKTSIRISTRPDLVDDDELCWCKIRGIKTIELGIQDFNNDVLDKARRGYNTQTALDACYNVKQAGLELGIQLMPGLQGFTTETLNENIKYLSLTTPKYLRIYPLVVLANTPLWDDFQAGLFNPMSLEEAIKVSVILSDAAHDLGIEVIKIGIPSLGKEVKYQGPYHPAFGEIVKAEKLVNSIIDSYTNESTIHIAKKDLSLLHGHKQMGLKKLLKRLDLCSLKIKLEDNLHRGKVYLSNETPSLELTVKEEGL